VVPSRVTPATDGPGSAMEVVARGWSSTIRLVIFFLQRDLFCCLGVVSLSLLLLVPTVRFCLFLAGVVGDMALVGDTAAAAAAFRLLPAWVKEDGLGANGTPIPPFFNEDKDKDDDDDHDNDLELGVGETHAGVVVVIVVVVVVRSSKVARIGANWIRGGGGTTSSAGGMGEIIIIIIVVAMVGGGGAPTAV
jgi:hypothetical protein